MLSERTRTRLVDIRENISLAQSFVTGLTFEQFRADAKTNLATIRCLEIISEASRHVDAECKARHPDIPWRNVADAGNAYRHGYRQVRLDYIWVTVTEMLPPLLAAVEAELE